MERSASMIRLIRWASSAASRPPPPLAARPRESSSNSRRAVLRQEGVGRWGSCAIVRIINVWCQAGFSVEPRVGRCWSRPDVRIARADATRPPDATRRRRNAPPTQRPADATLRAGDDFQGAAKLGNITPCRTIAATACREARTSSRSTCLTGTAVRWSTKSGCCERRCGTVRARAPFHIDAWVVLPEHLHCIWTLPLDDDDYSARWHAVKALFAAAMPPTEWRSPTRVSRGERGIWQRRFWEHTRGAHGLRPFQPGETRVGRARGGLAVFLVRSLRGARAVSGRLEHGRRRSRRLGRAAMSVRYAACVGGLHPPYEVCARLTGLWASTTLAP